MYTQTEKTERMGRMEKGGRMRRGLAVGAASLAVWATSCALAARTLMWDGRTMDSWGLFGWAIASAIVIFLLPPVLIIDMKDERLLRSDKSHVCTALLCAAFGFTGAHRFYAGKKATGIVYLLSGGVLGIGWALDAVLAISGYFTDAQGRCIGRGKTKLYAELIETVENGWQENGCEEEILIGELDGSEETEVKTEEEEMLWLDEWLIKRLREDSDAVRAALDVPEESESPQKEPAPAPIVEMGVSGLWSGLGAQERQLLRCALYKRGEMPEMTDAILDGINEKAIAALGDILIGTDEDGLWIAEEYEEEIRRLGGGTEDENNEREEEK